MGYPPGAAWPDYSGLSAGLVVLVVTWLRQQQGAALREGLLRGGGAGAVCSLL